MKIFPRKCIVISLITLLIVSACASSPLPPPVPTQSVTPTSSPYPTPIPAAVLLGDYALLSPEAMRSDLDELFHMIETTHPNPYAKRSKSEVDLDRQHIYDELSEPMTVIDFYRKVAPVVNSLRDSHTTVSLPDGPTLPILQQELFFPFDLQLENDHAYIVSNYSDHAEVKLGTELLEVNGIPVSIVREETNRYFPPGRYLNWPQFWLLFGSFTEFQVKLLLPDTTEPIILGISGITYDALRQTEAPTLLSYPAEALTYTRYPNESIGLLSINNFTDINQLVEPAFVEVKRDNIQHLIIDIRSNFGGTSEQVHTVMNYLTDQPYRFCSQIYTAAVGGNLLAGPRREDCDFREPFNTRYRFQRKLYLLIGPDTYSNGIGFANILQDHNLATLIGEETDDSASSCGDITIPGLSLLRTGLTYYISRTCYVRPNGMLDERGVIPDMIVKTTVRDRVTGKDPVLEYTLDMIRQGE